MILVGIQETAAQHPDTLAVQMKIGSEYRQYTYRELVKGVASVARSLSERGIGKGDRVALLSENRPEWIFAYLSTVSLGAVIVPFDAQLTEREIALLLASSGAKAVFVSAACRPKLPRDRSLMMFSFDPGGGLSFHEMLTAHPGAEIPPAPSPGDPAALLYTSGTTGDPKGVMLSHGNLVSNRESVIRLNLIGYGDNLLCLLPLHHTYPAIACIFYALAVGATVTILNSLKGPDITACMKETNVSVMLGVPQLFAGLRRAIFDEIRKKPAVVRLIVKLLLAANRLFRTITKKNMGKALFGAVHAKFGPALRLFASGGARLEADVYVDMTDLGFTIVEGYGLTETSPVTHSNPLYGTRKPGSIGVPLPDTDVRVVDAETGKTVQPVGEIGELVIRGPQVMRGSRNRPDETAAALRAGWLHTGDLATRDEQGFSYIVGRKKDMILCSGFNVYPDEVDRVLMGHPAILEAATIGLPDERRGETVKSFVVVRPGQALTAEQVIAHCREHLAPYKVPRAVAFRDALPRSSVLKILRRELREEELAKLRKQDLTA